MVVKSPPSSPQPSYPMSLGVGAAAQMGAERQPGGVDGVGQLGGVPSWMRSGVDAQRGGASWPAGVGTGQLGGASSS